jgi:hypothetical protein
METIKVVKATYTDGYSLIISFSDKSERIVDFEGFLNKQIGFLSKYKMISNFKSYHIENGNVVWGKDWDLIFPIEQLYKGNITL